MEILDDATVSNITRVMQTLYKGRCEGKRGTENSPGKIDGSCRLSIGRLKYGSPSQVRWESKEIVRLLGTHSHNLVPQQNDATS
jgi:hypothetical protein